MSKIESLDIAAAFGTDPVVDRVAMPGAQDGASMQGQVTLGHGSSDSGFTDIDRAAALAVLPQDAGIGDLLAARRAVIVGA